MIQRLEQSAGFQKKKASPKLAAYAYDLIKSDPYIQEGSLSAYLSTIRSHVEGSILDVPLSSIVEEPALVRKFWTNLTPMKSYAANGGGMKASVHQLLTKVFTQAVRHGVIPTSAGSWSSYGSGNGSGCGLAGSIDRLATTASAMSTSLRWVRRA